MLNQTAAGISPRRRASVMCVFLLPKRCRRTFCYQIAIKNDSKKPWDCRKIGNSKAFQTTYKPAAIIPTRPFQTSLKQIRLWELAHVIQIASIIQMVWAI